VRAGNTQALRFYSMLGYRETSRTVGYYSGVEDAVRLERELGVTNTKLRQSM
jgi:ribosomal protein S18 acetylase RimI-like enzyme